MAAVTLEQVYRDYYDKVTRFVRKKVADPTDAEDLVSEVFLKLTKNWDKFDPEKASASTWVYTIANNTVVDYYRTRKVHVEMPDEAEETRGLPQELIDYAAPDEQLMRAESLNDLARALEQLKEKERDLIILHYYQNMTLKEVAEKMGMSYINAKVIHKKALDKMQMLLGACG